MRNFVTRLRVWFPPPLILLLFFVTDVLTAIPRFTFDIVNIVLSVLLTGVCITMILHTACKRRLSTVWSRIQDPVT